MQRTPHETVIIKRKRRSGHEEQSGGAWKVAFADFTLALMSLFLVLWLLSVTNQKERNVLASNLRDYSVFDQSKNPFDLSNSPFPIDLEGQPAIVERVAAQLLTSGDRKSGISMYSQVPKGDVEPGKGQGPKLDSIIDGDFQSPESLAVLAAVIKEMAKQLTASNNLDVEVVPQGLRISIQDDKNRQMFARGSVNMSPFFEDLLMALAPVFQHVKNGMVISGHTDSIPYQSNQYSNWELSGDRALMARRVLEVGGMPKQRVLQVAAMSDRTPVDKSHPDASDNRRIEILLLTKKAQASLLSIFDRQQPGNALTQADKAAKANEPVTR
ncbi:flagellar motor protein MotB [Gallaecimonas pentaromativorans]|uniref:Chemotaxis protein MotB n=1 Tax=Gallaecimonas pentaromativorans TaxID=584787 RepID=A0A3N1P3G0_9GAMM|nr:flagellar motor protein MotB [Gallaecimonas pentaromativorans]ROQ25892.1 chemotaxis protein MotB [Gallaecimonas pentaromativorans]